MKKFKQNFFKNGENLLFLIHLGFWLFSITRGFSKNRNKKRYNKISYTDRFTIECLGVKERASLCKRDEK